ncbi:threonine aspartase 1-like isoform X3 [Ostrea edulis]|uniref:threonine aspartase 1-like isoform X3 n=1 Tax=Ostrea edulis TaxID=37623 RepID=UPI0024AF0CD5|nr:threonine aspartase 1-like isoform X3 [Ostrea edulis]
MSHYVIAVHCGAGYHSTQKEDAYKTLCKTACIKVSRMLEKNIDAVESVTEAVRYLENSELTNAGVGSNLNIRGSVECDAAIMEGKQLMFGAVGAISGVQNPVTVSAKLLTRQLGKKLSLGRLHPSVIVGEGANKWARENGLYTVDTGCLVTDYSRKTFNSHKTKLDILNEKINSKKRKFTVQSQEKSEESCAVLETEEGIQDTVGAIVMDTAGNIASAVSSGGISLKQPGRLGPAATYGAGCWAYNQRPGKPGVGTVTSGSGEHIMKTLLARESALSIQRENNVSLGLSNSFKESFLGCEQIKQQLQSEFLEGEKEKLAGVLALGQNEDKTATKRNKTADTGHPCLIPLCIMQVLDIHPLFFILKIGFAYKM